MIFKTLRDQLTQLKTDWKEVMTRMEDLQRKTKRLERLQQKAEEKARKFAESIKEYSEEEKQTAQSVFDEVDVYRNVEGKDLNFQFAREDYCKTCELFEETQKKIVELSAAIKAHQKQMQLGNIPEEDFIKCYELYRDRQAAFGMELALLNRKVASAVVFQDRIKRTFRA